LNSPNVRESSGDGPLGGDAGVTVSIGAADGPVDKSPPSLATVGAASAVVDGAGGGGVAINQSNVEQKSCRVGLQLFTFPSQMIIPVRCFSCGKVVGDKWDQYLNLLQQNYTEGYGARVKKTD
jgi:hypothetical protein